MDDDHVSKLIALALTQDASRRSEMKIIKEMLSMVIAMRAADMDDGEAYVLRLSETFRFSLDQSCPPGDLGKEMWSQMEATIDEINDKVLTYLNLERVVRSDRCTPSSES